MTERIFGDIPGYPIGSTFEDKWELFKSGVHRHLLAGIAGIGKDGAESIILNGVFEDDQDHGDAILYTRQGPHDSNGRVTADQVLERGNVALARSRDTGLPVRVVRGSMTEHGPSRGYRYDGLYRVQTHSNPKGKGGYRILLFTLVKI